MSESTSAGLNVRMAHLRASPAVPGVPLSGCQDWQRLSTPGGGSMPSSAPLIDIREPCGTGPARVGCMRGLTEPPCSGRAQHLQMIGRPGSFFPNTRKKPPPVLSHQLPTRCARRALRADADHSAVPRHQKDQRLAPSRVAAADAASEGERQAAPRRVLTGGAEAAGRLRSAAARLRALGPLFCTRAAAEPFQARCWKGIAWYTKRFAPQRAVGTAG